MGMFTQDKVLRSNPPKLASVKHAYNLGKSVTYSSHCNGRNNDFPHVFIFSL